jgi:hypothetical protein
MPRSGKYLGHASSFEVGEQRSSAALVPDKLLTLLSIRCQRRSGRAKAVVLRFVQSHQVQSAQAVALALIELARPTTTPWNGSGNAARDLERCRKRVMSRSSSTRLN